MKRDGSARHRRFSLASISIGAIVIVAVLLCGILIGRELGNGSPAEPLHVTNPAGSPAKGTATVKTSPLSSFPDASNTGFRNAPGYPDSLTECGSLIIKSNTTYKFCDFPDGLAIGSEIKHLVNVSFVGCRFASHEVADADVADYGQNITFSYSTFEPNTVSVNSEPTSPDAKPISAADSYQYGIDLRYSGALTIDHSDFWGFSDAIQFANSGQSNPLIVRNSWIHNPALDPTGAAHVDGILDSDGGASYMTFYHNTIVGDGNTQAIALQGDTEGYYHVVITDNYFSGYGYTICIGTHSLSNDVTFTGNVLGTDLKPTYGPIYSGEIFATGGLGNVWRDNSYYVVPGTSWLAAANNKLYWWPEDTNPSNPQEIIGHTTDYTGP